ncbi:ATP-binding protein [Cytobacillus sp. NCCP-133]|uniref:ATP-binding protein n=1 Tax=Cytobacillus sp. NCCP-133 TaxID=766848 RepID=UPI00222E7B9C|nr:sensor histidine kinase [Cytobacillus sp. NCCP-133]GLB61659.1 sensor histidine kinase [Cytobacillus sp. NCCP-133]
MKTKKLPMSLQTKIIGSNILNTVFIIFIFFAISLVIEYKHVEKQMGKQALQLAIAVSSMPSVVSSFEKDEPSKILQPMVNKIRKETGAEFIVIGNTEGVRYAHPDDEKLGLLMVGGDNSQALKGEFYISKAKGSLGNSIRGKGPIKNEEGQIIGVVSVGYLMEDLQETVLQRGKEFGFLSLFVIMMGVIASYLLARNIRRTTLGMEPYEMTSLYLERNAILYSTKEGIISVDKHGFIKMINQSAKNLLGVKDDILNQKIETILPNTGVYRVLQTGEPDRDHEVTLRNRDVIINRTPIFEKGQVIGAVSTFRDKTEINHMVETLTEVKKYSEDLRAQTHEFSNKLYVISGLLQLGNYDDAIKMIQAESAAIENQNKIIFEQIHDPKVQALLLGKLGKASEKKIQFRIDENSSMDVLPAHFSYSEVISIIGNLIDNAFEAVEERKDGEVTFFAIDVGEDLVMEVYDNGQGIPEEQSDKIFEKGYSTKGGQNRGFGLAIVKQSVENLNGTIELQSTPGSGTVLSIYLPKKQPESKNER